VAPTGIKSIMVMAYGHIADVLPALAALRALRQTYPDAHIVVFAVEYVREMFERCPDVNEVLIIKDFKHKATRRAKLEKLVRLAQLTPRVYGRYDMALVFHAQLGFLTHLAWASGARIRAGFDDGEKLTRLTHPARPMTTRLSFREENRRVLEAIGITTMGKGLDLTPTDEDIQAMRSLLAAEGVAEGALLIGLHPGSHWTCQQWNPRQWGALADELVTRHDATLVITGSQEEDEWARAICDHMTVKAARVINATGKTSIMQFAALIRLMDCLVCVNSAASQLALAVHTPVVNLVGFENPVWTAPVSGEPMTMVRGCDDSTAVENWCPYNVWGKLSQCHRAECIDIGGLALIQRDRVLREVEKWLEASEQSPTYT
jgi:ADP-heptose:LPS heptosyltransferase